MNSRLLALAARTLLAFARLTKVGWSLVKELGLSTTVPANVCGKEIMMLRNRLAIGFLACWTLTLVTASNTWAADDESSAKKNSPLEQLVDLNYDEQPLTAIVADLGKQADVSIRFNRASLDEYGIDPSEARVTLKVDQIPLRHALYWVGKPHDLMWQQRGRNIILATEEESLGSLKLFDVLDLVRESPDSRRVDYFPLINLITWVIYPDTWEAVGGAGTIRPANGMLAIRQYSYVEGGISPLLDNLREAIAAGKASTEKSPTKTSIDLEAGKDDVLRDAVKRPWKIGMMAKEMALTEFAELLHKSYKVPIVVDHNALEEIGLDASVEVRPPEGAESLTEALHETLDDLGLGWYVAHGALVLSGDFAVETHLSTRAYPVGDMLGHFVTSDAFGDDQMDFELDDLIDLLTSTVEPESWDEVGGPGSIDAWRDNLLLVTQTQQAHSVLEKQLGDLRRAFAKRGDVERPKLKDRQQRMRLVVYVFATPESEEKRLALEKELRKQNEKNVDTPSAPGFGGPGDVMEPRMPVDPEIDPFGGGAGGGDDDPFGGGGVGGAGVDPFGDGGAAGGIEADPFGGGGAPPAIDPFDDSVNPFADPPGTKAPPEKDPFGEENPFGDLPRSNPDERSTPADVLANRTIGGFGFASFALDQPTPISEEKMLEIIQGLIEPASWRQNEKVFAATAPGRIIILHTEDVHQRILELSGRLRIKDFHELVDAPFGWPLPIVGGGLGTFGSPRSGGFF